MTIYDRPTRDLMHDFAGEKLTPGKVISKQEAVSWFGQRYPKLNSNTVRMHVEGMSVNSKQRIHHPNIKPGLNWDLFYKMGSDQYRLWDKKLDPTPKYKADYLNDRSEPEATVEENDESSQSGSAEFALEADLQRYLAKNLHVLEPGLILYQDEDGGFNGLEYEVGGRYIDILAVGKDEGLVVVELKVSRGYDRVIGQLLRYMAWVKKNIANGKPVRGIIVASDTSEDLKLAASQMQDVSLFNYELSFSVKRVSS